jgi:hypothetical protein
VLLLKRLVIRPVVCDRGLRPGVDVLKRFAPRRPESVTLCALDLGGISSPAPLEIEVFANCVVKQTHD